MKLVPPSALRESMKDFRRSRNAGNARAMVVRPWYVVAPSLKMTTPR
jgi:hypothetical protein